MNIYIDIETIPAQRSYIKEETYRKVKRLKKDTDEEYSQKQDEAWRKTALDGSYGEIVCIGWAIDDSEIKTFWRDLSCPEKDFLNRFFVVFKDSILQEEDLSTRYCSSIRNVKWIGHNVLFDIRFIYQRAVIHGEKPSIELPLNAKPWSNEIFDTMTEWSGYKNTISLSNLCKALDIPGKDTDLEGELIDGSKVWDFVQKGEIER
jgi:hypothetical protein